MQNIKDIVIFQNVSLKKYNTYKIEAKAKYLIHVLSIPALVELLCYLKKNKIPYFILGAGSNLILDEYFDGAVIKLKGFDSISIQDNVVEAEAGVMMASLALETIQHHLTGLEWVFNIPGTVGGSIVNNAGAYNSEMFDSLVRIKVLDQNLNIKEISKEELQYQYRQTNIADLGYIVLSGTFLLEEGNPEESKRLMKDRCERRKNSQPLDMPSAGSVFRNPLGDSAGRLIEQAGLKGRQLGGAKVSEKHANFIVNTGNATSNDIKNLIKLIQTEVKNQFHVDLILEQEIVDWKNENGKCKKGEKEKIKY